MGKGDVADRRHFRRGIIINLLSPTSATFFVVLIPSFAGGASAELSTVLTMSAIYIGIATLTHALIVVFASSFQKALAHPGRELLVRRIFALTLVGVAVWFVLST